jgi:hypothetical protein
MEGLESMNFEPVTDNQQEQANDVHRDVSGIVEAQAGKMSTPSCELFEGGLGI